MKHKLHKDRKSFKKWGLSPTIELVATLRHGSNYLKARLRKLVSKQTHKCISHYDSTGALKFNQTIKLK